MPCFNAIDIVSRYPTGLAFPQRRSRDAADFLIHTWQEIGIPQYTQVDNEGCFSGGATHPYVLGRVVRLALQVGTELVFSPVYHPASNGYIERFHQDYDRHVWEDTYLANRAQVNQQATHFFADYRDSLHHSALDEQSPNQLHWLSPPVQLGTGFSCPDKSYHSMPVESTSCVRSTPIKPSECSTLLGLSLPRYLIKAFGSHSLWLPPTLHYRSLIRHRLLRNKLCWRFIPFLSPSRFCQDLDTTPALLDSIHHSP